MRNEAEFRKHVTKLVEDAGGHVSNIESHLTSAGVPDMNVGINGADVWLELKYLGTKCRMRPTQRRWHRARRACGGTSWVLIYDPRSEEVIGVPGHIAAEHVDLRTLAAETRVPRFNLHQLVGWINSLTQGPKNEKHRPHRDRTPESTGSAEASLRTGGQTVERDHWLLDKP